MLSTRRGGANREPGAPAIDTGPDQPSLQSLEPRRVLVLRLGALGDVVRTRFAFGGVRTRYPRARIDWLVEDRAAPGLVGTVGLDEVVCVPRRELRLDRPARLWSAPRGLVRDLRSRRYDLAVDFHSILKSALLARAARIPVRVGLDRPHAREGSHRLMTHRVRPGWEHVSRFARNAALVRALGGEVPAQPPPVALAPDAARALGPLPERFATLHPGTSPTTLYKRWEAERYAEVARALFAEGGLESVVTWGPVPGERESAEAVVAGAGGAAVLGPETRDLGALLALLARGSLFVGSDSGPLHLAALVGCPIVAVFGPTDPVENAPYPGVPSRVVRRDVGCNPCREGCPARACMAAVESGEVVRAALDLVARSGPAE